MAVISNDLRGVGAALALLAPHVSCEYQPLVTLARRRLLSLAGQVERLEGRGGLPWTENGGCAPVAPVVPVVPVVPVAPVASLQAVCACNPALCGMGDRRHGPLQ